MVSLLLPSVVTVMVVPSEFIEPLSYFGEVSSNVVLEALAVGIGIIAWRKCKNFGSRDDCFGVVHVNIENRVQLPSTIWLSGPNWLRLSPCFAGQDAFGPRVTKLCVTSTSAGPEPRTTATTATSLTRFLGDAAFGACETAYRRRGCWYA